MMTQSVWWEGGTFNISICNKVAPPGSGEIEAEGHKRVQPLSGRRNIRVLKSNRF